MDKKKRYDYKLSFLVCNRKFKFLLDDILPFFDEDEDNLTYKDKLICDDIVKYELMDDDSKFFYK